MHYRSIVKTITHFKIFLSIDSNSSQLIHLYENLFQYHYKDLFTLISWDFNIHDEEILLGHLLTKNTSLIYLTLIFYFLSLIFFVKNFFFIFIIVLHILSTSLLSILIYDSLLHLPFTILNVNSAILYLFLVLIDAFLWYSCWFINHHRRDDCTIQRIIENLLTQTFFYILPKNLTAIIVLVITYTNQVLAIQYFTVLAFLLIWISFFISFTIYPGKRGKPFFLSFIGEKEMGLKFSFVYMHPSLSIIDSDNRMFLVENLNQTCQLSSRSNHSVFNHSIQNNLVNFIHHSLLLCFSCSLSMAEITIRCLSINIRYITIEFILENNFTKFRYRYYILHGFSLGNSDGIFSSHERYSEIRIYQ